MNFRYVEALKEIQHLSMKAFIKGDDDYALAVFKEISEKINAALDGAAGVRALPLPGCPSLMPTKVIPHDEPAAEVSRLRTQQEYFKQHYSICDGTFPIRRGNSDRLLTTTDVSHVSCLVSTSTRRDEKIIEIFLEKAY